VGSGVPELGVAKTAGTAARVPAYRCRAVARIKHLLLSKAHAGWSPTRLEEEGTPVASGAPLDELIGRRARALTR